MTEQSYALRLLDKNCYLFDRRTPFIMTSPLSGMAHGGYFFRDLDGTEIYEMFNRAHHTAYSEFGCSSISDRDILTLALPQDEIRNPGEGASWVSHHGSYAFQNRCWAMLDLLEDYFGKSTDN